MFTLRCTRKLLRRLRAAPTSAPVAPTTVLGDWYANLLFTRPEQLVLCMNERSLLCVVVPARPSDQLGPRLRDAASALLLAIGVPVSAVSAETRAMEEMTIGATASRAILGCMNDAALHVSLRFGSGVPLREVDRQLADNIYSLTGYEKPRVRAMELFRVAGSAERPAM